MYILFIITGGRFAHTECFKVIEKWFALIGSNGLYIITLNILFFFFNNFYFHKYIKYITHSTTNKSNTKTHSTQGGTNVTLNN